MAVSRTFLLSVLLAGAELATAAQPKREEVMLAELSAMLGGSYDNLAQARASSEHPALRLMVVPVEAPGVGDHVFYVQEVAADDARRVLAQRLYVLDVVPKREQSVMTQLDFNEPNRWRDGQLKRDLFRQLLREDLRVRTGCEMLWSRKPQDKVAAKKTPLNAFTATTGSGCRAASRVTGETVKVEQRLELDAEGLAVFEQQRDAGGALVAGDLRDPFFRFTRRADAPW
ncbi:MAG: chromophore lyase CpcT/CpeT [Pseudomonadota bacterium]